MDEMNKSGIKDFSEDPHELSDIKRVVGVISGKGGVGKSAVTAMLAVTMNRRGHKSAILDADITGPSIPMMFGIKTKATGSDIGMFPVKSRTGINIMSINLILENESDPVIWRGPILGNTVKQFWKDVIWGDIDYLFIDMPPGTGDVPLTIFQSIRIDGVIVVASPQELVGMVVAKALKMAEKMNIPVLGLVENMSYFKCPGCGSEHEIFGKSNLNETAGKHGIDSIAKIPLDPRISAAGDRGMIELFDGDWLDEIAVRLEKI